MNILESYLSFLNKVEEQAPVTGFMNYMEDRMKIMNMHKVGMMKCFNKFKAQQNQLKKNLGMYQCEIPVLEGTISRLQSASQKCTNTKFPEKCEVFYNGLIPKLEYKIKFNKAQLDTIKRKMGLTKYD